MVVDKIFNALKQKDRTLTKSRFSREYLGKDSNYLFVCRARQKDISDTALLKLYGRLQSRDEEREDGETTATMALRQVKNGRDDEVDQLVSIAWAEIERRAIS